MTELPMLVAGSELMLMELGLGVRSLPLFGGPLKLPALHWSSMLLHLSSQMLQLALPDGCDWSQQAWS